MISQVTRLQTDHRQKRNGNNGIDERSLIVDQSSHFTYECKNSDGPYKSPAVLWFKVDSGTGTATPLPIRKRNETGDTNVYCDNADALKLVIKKVTENDMGVYECRDQTRPDDVKVRLNIKVNSELFIASIFI